MFLGFFGLPLIIVVGVVLLALAGKSEPDPKRERPVALYLSVITLVGVLFLLGATFVTANGLVELTDTSATDYFVSTGIELGSDEFGPDFRSNVKFGEDKGNVNHDDDVSQIIGGLIIGAIALAVIRFHAPKLQELADNSEAPGARIYARFLYLVCGASLLTAVGAAGATVYGVYGAIAPDTAGAGEVTDALRALLSAAALAAVAALIFQRAWKRSEDLAAVAAAPPEPESAPAPVKKAVAKRAAPPKG